MLARIPLQGGSYQRVREDLNEMGHAIFVGDAAYWFNVGKGISFQVTGKLFHSDVPTSHLLHQDVLEHLHIVANYEWDSSG